jgi:hypothetical protein
MYDVLMRLKNKTKFFNKLKGTKDMAKQIFLNLFKKLNKKQMFMGKSCFLKYEC